MARPFCIRHFLRKRPWRSLAPWRCPTVPEHEKRPNAARLFAPSRPRVVHAVAVFLGRAGCNREAPLRGREERPRPRGGAKARRAGSCSLHIRQVASASNARTPRTPRFATDSRSLGHRKIHDNQPGCGFPLSLGAAVARQWQPGRVPPQNSNVPNHSLQTRHFDVCIDSAALTQAVKAWILAGIEFRAP